MTLQPIVSSEGLTDALNRPGEFRLRLLEELSDRIVYAQRRNDQTITVR